MAFDTLHDVITRIKKKAQEYFNARQNGEDKLKAFERTFGMDTKALRNSTR